MRVLLDTHAFLWFALNDPALSAAARTAIADPSNDVLVSPASYWEIAIKVSKGKYQLNEPFLTFMEDQIAVNRFVVLPIEPRHTAAIIGLPFHHKDPFDRLLVAQAMTENIPLVSCDSDIARYGIPMIW